MRSFATAHQIPVVQFKKDDRKQEVMRPYLERRAATGLPGVAAIGVAQEYQNVFAASERHDQGSAVMFTVIGCTARAGRRRRAGFPRPTSGKGSWTASSV